MAKIVIAGDAAVVKSALKLEDIRTVAKYRPKALWLYGGEDGKEPVFAIGVTEGTGSIGPRGVSFGRETHDEERLAVVTMVLPDLAGDVKEYVAEKIGPAIVQLDKLETTIPAVLAEIEAERQSVLSHITVAE